MILLLFNSFKWQYMAGAGAGAEIRDKGGTGAENKLFRLRNTGQNSSLYEPSQCEYEMTPGIRTGFSMLTQPHEIFL